MIWCFGFFFLWLQCDLDEGSHQPREALQMLTLMTDTVQRPDNNHIAYLVSWYVNSFYPTSFLQTNRVEIKCP